jgi:hypothetical protein
MPDLFNRTPGHVELVPLIDPRGSNVLVVITKVTYEYQSGRGMVVAAEQEPVTFADVPSGPPQAGALRCASDITAFKPSTDVVVTAPETPPDTWPARGREIDVTIGPVRFGGKVAAPWPFGPIGPAKEPRRRYAGTYDGVWLEQRFPLLPGDFDPRHNQVAPPAQIAPQPLAGNEMVTVRNLYARDEMLRAALPGRTVVVAGNVRGRYFTEIALLDTVTLSSERPVVSLVWRLAIRPRQKVEEVRNVFTSMAMLRSTRELYGKP